MSQGDNSRVGHAEHMIVYLLPWIAVLPHQSLKGMASLVDLVPGQVLFPLFRVPELIAHFFRLPHGVGNVAASVQLVLLLSNLHDLLSGLHVLVHIDFSMHARQAFHLLNLPHGTHAAAGW